MIKSLLIIVLLSISLFVCYCLLYIFKYSYNGFICVVLQSLTCVQIFVTSQTAAHQASMSFTISWGLLKVKSTELMMLQPSHPLSSPSPPALNLSQHQSQFSNESVLCIRWPKYWSSSFSISEYSGLISFRIE